MKTYKIIYTEALYHVFYVEAESEEAAREKFNEEAADFDYSNGEVYDSGVESIEEVTK